MPSSRGTAFGKLILLGEHAVVYGVPALVLGIDRRLTAVAERAERSELRLLSSTRVADPHGEDPMQRAFAALLDYPPAIGGVRVEVDGDLSPGVGLGFSAAAGVAVARAAVALAGHGSAAGIEDEVRERATAWERVFHGNPSGVDVAAAMTGGCLRFARGEGIRPVALGARLVLCVGLTGTRSSTREMVEGVAALRAQRPELVDASVSAIGGLVESGVAAIEDGNAPALGALMDLAQELLASLGVSNATIEKMCRSARDAGALGAKLTGAGGGGAVVALASDANQAQGVLRAWRTAGFEGFVVEQGDGR